MPASRSVHDFGFIAAVIGGIASPLGAVVGGLYLAIATLAFSLLADSLTVGLEGWTGGPSGLVGIPSFSLGPVVFDTALSNYYLVGIILVAVLALLTGGIRGGFGRALQAIPADPLAASALGINVPAL